MKSMLKTNFVIIANLIVFELGLEDQTFSF